MLGIRAKLKKLSCSVGHKKENTPLTVRVSTRTPTRAFPQTPTRTSLATSPVRNNASNNTNTNRTSTKTMPMMTPDMVEVLGLTESHFRTRKPKKISSIVATATPMPIPIPSPPTTAVTRSPSRHNPFVQTPNERRASKSKISRRYSDTSSCYDVADTETKVSICSTTSTSSSSDSYEPVPPHPFDPCDPYIPCQDDMTFLDGHDNDGDGNETNTYMQYYRDSTVADCYDPLMCASIVLATPVACGMLCIDNVIGTNLFDPAAESFRKHTSVDPCNPEILTIKQKRTKRSHRKKKRINQTEAATAKMEQLHL